MCLAFGTNKDVLVIGVTRKGRDVEQTPRGRLSGFAIWSDTDDPIHLGAKTTLWAGKRLKF
jgi:hypothetical protein